MCNAMKKCFFVVFLLSSFPLCLNAQIKEIQSIKQQMPAITDSCQYVDALNRLSVLYHTKSVDTCFIYAQQAKAMADRLNYKKGQAYALDNLGVVSLLKQNTYLSSKYFNNALSICRNIGDSAGECLLLMHVGLTYANNKKFAECGNYLTAAYKLGSSIKYDSVLSLVIVNLINDTTIREDSVNALLLKADEVAARYSDFRALIILEQAKASRLFDAGKTNEALTLLQKALQGAETLDVEYQVIGVGIDFGDYFFKLKDTAKALNYYKTALKKASDNGYENFVIETALKLYNYYTAKGNYADAAEYAAILVKQYQGFVQAVQQTGVNYLDYSLKEEELANLKSNRQITNYVMVTLALLCITVIALLFFMFRSYQARKKYVELLKERNVQVGNRNVELQFKNDFNNRLISLLAHDFRQPLAAVKGMMGLLKEPDALSKEEFDFLVSRIENSSDTSLDIFDNILHWIKKQVSGFVYEPVNLQMANLVDDAAGTLGYVTEKFSVTVINNIAADMYVKADKEMLQFVNRNLIHNAIKFSPSNSVILVNAEKKDREIVVSVKDQGKGMTAEALDALFNIFSKNQYSSDKEKGSGVALVICKDFLERMNGRIWAESQPGQGTVFYYTLPLGD
jgi:signal transduction histidine kinase